MKSEYTSITLSVENREKKKPNETITGNRYQLQLMRLIQEWREKRPLYEQRHDKVLLQHENARPHVAKTVKMYLENKIKISASSPITELSFYRKTILPKF